VCEIAQEQTQTNIEGHEARDGRRWELTAGAGNGRTTAGSGRAAAGIGLGLRDLAGQQRNPAGRQQTGAGGSGSGISQTTTRIDPRRPRVA
jgi:hypothetical protein